mgnify:CR=1 FL=1
MFYRYLSALWAIFLALDSYTQIKEDFDDSLSLSWHGQPELFTVNASGELQLNDNEAGEAFIVTENRLFDDSVIWEFRLRMDFNPSGSNLSRIYLAADQDDFLGSLNGFFVQVGDTPDEISLYRQQDTDVDKLIDGKDDVVDLSSVDARVRVVRTKAGHWTLFHDVGLSGSWTLEGTASDTSSIENSWFGWWCDYTSTRSDRFFLDDVKVSGLVAIDSIVVNSRDSLLVVFNQPVKDIEAGQVKLSTTGESVGIKEANLSSDNSRLNILTSLATGNYTVFLEALSDSLTDTYTDNLESTFSYRQLELTSIGAISDSLIVMRFNDSIDESSAKDFQTYSFSGIAIGNLTIADDRKGVRIQMNRNFIDAEQVDIRVSGLENKDKNSRLDTSTVWTYQAPLIVTKLRVKSHHTIEIVFNKPLNPASLQTENFTLNGGLAISSLELSSERQLFLTTRDQLQTGSVSVFIKDLQAADDAPIPPGYVVAVDFSRLKLAEVSTVEKDLYLRFNQSVDKSWNLSPSIFSIGELGPPAGVRLANDSTITVSYERTSNAVFRLSIDSLVNATGNSYLVDTLLDVRWTRPVEKQTVVFSEIMVDPTPAVGLPEIEYVELYNRSDLPVRIEGYLLNGKALPTFQMVAGEYLVLYDQPDIQGLPGEALLIDKLDALTNGGESLVLQTHNGNLMDSLRYASSWYDNSERDDGGYSLELIDTDFLCHDDYSWTASISDIGGTPGAPNSMQSVLTPDSLDILAELEILNDSVLRVSFNIPMDIKSAHLSNRVITDIHRLSYSSYELFPDRQLTSEQNYVLRIDSLQFCGRAAAFSYEKQFYFDNSGPILQASYPISASQLALIFQEPLLESVAEREENYLINGQKPARAVRQDSAVNRIHLELEQIYQEGDTLQVDVLLTSDTLSNETSALSKYLRVEDNLKSARFIASDLIVVQFKNQPSIQEASKSTNYFLEAIGRPEEVVADPHNSKVYKLRLKEAARENRLYKLYIDGMWSTDGDLLSALATELMIDTRVPAPDSLIFTGESSLTLVFNEPISITDAVNPLNYRWQNEVPDQVVPLDHDRVELFFSDMFPQEKEVEITVIYARDIAGNRLSKPVSIASLYDTRPPEAIQSIQFNDSTIRVICSEAVDISMTTVHSGVTVENIDRLAYDLSIVEISFRDSLPETESFTILLEGLSDLSGNRRDSLWLEVDTKSMYATQTYFTADTSVRAIFSKIVDTAKFHKMMLPSEVSSFSFRGNELSLTLKEARGDGDTLAVRFDSLASIGGGHLQNPELTFVYRNPLSRIEVKDTSLLELYFEEPLTSSISPDNFDFADRVILVTQSPDDQRIVRLLSDMAIPRDSLLQVSWMALRDQFNRPLPNGSSEIYLDTRGPNVMSVVSLTGDQLLLQWSEPVQTSRLSKENFHVAEHSLHAVEHPDQLHSLLSFDTLLPDKRYLLTYKSVFDSIDNQTSVGEIDFNYTPPRLPAYGDVVINEIMADPTPSRGLPEQEYIELYNNSEYNVELNTLIFSDERAAVQLPGYSLSARSFVVLGGEMNADFSEKKYIYIPNFPTLNNDGEKLILRTIRGSLVDSIKYTRQMYDEDFIGGYALERINPGQVCNQRLNWSSHERFGSPGEENVLLNLLPDSTAPTILSYSWPSDRQLMLNFSEKMDTLLLGNLDPLAARVEFLDDMTCSISLSQPLRKGQIYELVISGFADCSGNQMKDLNLEYGIGKKPEKLELLLTEIMSDPSPSVDLPEKEYIEIFNASEELISLDDLYLVDESGRRSAFSGVIRPGEYLAFSGTEDTIYNLRKLEGSISLSNEGEFLELTWETDGNRENIASILYSKEWQTEENDGGYSLELFDLADPCIGKSWGTSRSLTGGTPGQENSQIRRPSEKREVHQTRVSLTGPYSLSIQFSEPLINANEVEFRIDDIEIENAKWQYADQFEVHLELTDSLLENSTYRLVTGPLENCQRKRVHLDSITFTVPATKVEGIVISEIHFDPAPEGAEFIELHNTSSNYYDLSKVSIVRDGDVYPLSEQQQVLEPSEFLALTEDVEVILRSYPDANLHLVARLPALPNESEVLLLLSEADRLDSIYYHEDFHSSLLSESKGVSLERLDMGRSAVSGTNWASASAFVDYATPGMPNSQYLIERTSEQVLEIAPKVFVPYSNTAGSSSYANISYRTGHTDLIGSVSIFDRQGRLIRRLANNEALSSEGSLPWDGTDQTGRLVPFGRYIVVFEAFNREGVYIEQKSTVVVGWNF